MSGSRVYLPALRGYFGDWVFYSCLMPASEVVDRVQLAEEIHPSKRLADYIQRQVEGRRAKEIASYLAKEPQRFFNSLVVGVYGGDPHWHELGSIDSDFEVPEETVASIGLLDLSGDEKLFAIDGQHRVAGLRVAVPADEALGAEELSLLLVAHKKTASGRRRTRRLFTTLNKTAKKASKGEIIALDEDDAMAIIARRLLDEHEFLAGERILLTHTDNLPTTNHSSLTTLGNLYDVLGILFHEVGRFGTLKRLRHGRRPDDERLGQMYALADRYLRALRGNFEELRRFFENKSYERVVSENRTEEGGHVLFRPIGLKIFTRLLGDVCHGDRTLESAVELLALLPTSLDEPPYAGVLWDPKRHIMVTGGAPLTRRLLRYQLGFDEDRSKLQEELKNKVVNAEPILPARVV